MGVGNKLIQPVLNGRPTVGSKVVVLSTVHTCELLQDWIGKDCIITADDGSKQPFRVDDNSVWLYAEDVRAYGQAKFNAGPASNGRKRKASEAGVAGASTPLPGQNFAWETVPCSACGRNAVTFSKRQMKVESAKRRCIECMPTDQPAGDGTSSSREKGPAPPPPVENMAPEPCSKCGRFGVAYSNRQMKADAAARRCIECMSTAQQSLDPPSTSG